MSQTANGRKLPLSLPGRWSEVVGPYALTTAVQMVIDAQQRAQHVLWLGARTNTVFPPDLVRAGVSLERLFFAFVPEAPAMGVVADEMLRSTAIGLCLFDFASFASEKQSSDLTPAMTSRLLGLAQKHQVVLVRVLEKASLNPVALVSLRLETERTEAQRIAVHVTKDKKLGPGGFYELATKPVPGMSGILTVAGMSETEKNEVIFVQNAHRRLRLYADT